MWHLGLPGRPGGDGGRGWSCGALEGHPRPRSGPSLEGLDIVLHAAALGSDGGISRGRRRRDGDFDVCGLALAALAGYAIQQTLKSKKKYNAIFLCDFDFLSAHL